MEIYSSGAQRSPRRLFSIKSTFPLLTVDGPSVTRVPWEVDVYRDVTITWQAVRPEEPTTAASIPRETFDSELDPGAEQHLAPLFSPRETSIILDILAARLPTATAHLTAHELPITEGNRPKRRISWPRRELIPSIGPERLTGLCGAYNRSDATYVTTIPETELEPEPAGAFSRLRKAVAIGKKYDDPPDEPLFEDSL